MLLKFTYYICVLDKTINYLKNCKLKFLLVIILKTSFTLIYMQMEEFESSLTLTKNLAKF